jgi:hypothetical protein
MSSLILTAALLAPAPSQSDGEDDGPDPLERTQTAPAEAPRRAPELEVNPRFRPWSPFYILRRGNRGTLSLLGTTFGGTVECVDARASACPAIAEAGLAIGWRPRRSLVTFFAGLTFGSYGASLRGNQLASSTGVGVVAGLHVFLPRWLTDRLRR